MSPYTTTGKLPATLDFPFQAGAPGLRARASRRRGLRDCLRRRRLVHRHRLQRLRAADLPRQPRHGPHRHVPQRNGGATGQTCCSRDQLAHDADVPHPRPAGRLLRRRAGLHRRRRRQGRPAGHVRHPGRRATPTTTCSDRPHHGRSTTTTPTHRCTSTSRRSPAARRQPGAARRRADPPVRRRRRRHLRVLAGSTRRDQVEYLVAVEQRDHREDGDLRHLRPTTRRSARSTAPATSVESGQRRPGRRSPSRRCRSRCWKADRADRRSRKAAPAVYLTTPAAPAASSAAAPRSAPRSRRRLRPGQLRRPAGRHDGVDSRSAPTTTRRTGSSRTSPASPRAPLVEYRAVVKDAAGHVSATSSYGDRRRPRPGGGGGGGVGPVTQPDNVSRPGRPQHRDGLPGRLAAGLRQAQLTLDADGPDLEGHLHAIPAGNYDYKAAINKSWDENYGAGGVQGRREHLATPRPAAPVTFYYDHAHALGHLDAQGPIITAPGSLPDRARLRRRLEPGLHAAVAAGPGRRRHLHLVAPTRSRPAATSSRSRTASRGTRTTGRRRPERRQHQRVGRPRRDGRDHHATSLPPTCCRDDRRAAGVRARPDQGRRRIWVDPRPGRVAGHGGARGTDPA